MDRERGRLMMGDVAGARAGLLERARQGFGEAFGSAPSHGAWAPGRVNLIGEHTDYNAGLALPIAIDRGCVTLVRANGGARDRLVALDIGRRVGFEADEPETPAWSRYLSGVIALMRERLAGPDAVDVAIASSVPIGAGLALSDKYKGNDRVTFTYFGDGAANQGQVAESYNMAQLWDLPVIFVIENNQYAMGTSVKRATKSPDFWERGAAYGIAGEAVDGMDVLAVKAAGEKAVAHCRAGKGPYILEVMTYRYRGHSMSDPAKYRTREEVQEMREKRDAIEHVRQMLLTGDHASEEELKKIDKEIKDIVNEAAEFSKESPEPDLSELWTDIYAPENQPAPQDA